MTSADHQHRWRCLCGWRAPEGADLETLLAHKPDCPGVRPHRRPDGIPTRVDTLWWTGPEKAIAEAATRVELLGASEALTKAVTLLAQARELVADHVEGIAPSVNQFPAPRDESGRCAFCGSPDRHADNCAWKQHHQASTDEKGAGDG